MNKEKQNLSNQVFRKISPLRASFLDILEEKERKNIVYPRKLTAEEKSEIKSLIK